MSYDLAICRSDIPADLVYRATDDWESRFDDPDTPGTHLEPTYNHGLLLAALGVRPRDMDGLDAATVAIRLREACARIETLGTDRLDREYYTDAHGGHVAWGGGARGCLNLLRNMLDYCQRHPDFVFHCL